MEGAMDRRKRPARDELAAVRERASRCATTCCRSEGESAGEAEPTLRESLRQERKAVGAEQRRLRKADFEHLCVIGRGRLRFARAPRRQRRHPRAQDDEQERDGAQEEGDAVHAERTAGARGQPWIVKLYYSFHDANSCTWPEFLPGGDLMQLLVREDTFTEQAARFYIAQAAQAVATVPAGLRTAT